MHPQMTAEQREVFCNAAATGVALGLEHRYEWYYNAIRMLAHGLYADIPAAAHALTAAFTAFEKMTCSCPEDEKELWNLTEDQYAEKVNNWYNRPRVQG